MSKTVFTIVAILLLNFAPLAAKPELILNYKSILLAIAAACLWLSQPAFSASDSKRDKNSDKFTILLILCGSSVTVVSSVTEWGYVNRAVESSMMFTMIGAFLLITGIYIRVWAIRVLGKHFTATVTLTNDHQLVKSGPYRWVRHPSYLGAFMALLGCPLFLNAYWAAVIAFIVMTVAYYFRIGVEEKMLSAYFGNQYRVYKENSKRFIPFIW